MSHLTLVLSACAPPSPGLERFEDATSAWMDVGPIEVQSLRGTRDGAEVRATGEFLHGDDRIRISLELHLDPPARFVAGTHESLIGGVPIEGGVASESVDFLGGQSTTVSVGGVYVLENASGAPRFRIRFPPTLLTRDPAR